MIFFEAVPNKQLPFLVYNGTTICESYAIGHFLAKKAGLCGKNEVEAAKAEMIVLMIGDLMASKHT